MWIDKTECLKRIFCIILLSKGLYGRSNGRIPGGLIPGRLRISREFPQGGRSLGASISSSMFDFPTLSTEIIHNNPK